MNWEINKYNLQRVGDSCDCSVIVGVNWVAKGGRILDGLLFECCCGRMCRWHVDERSDEFGGA